MSGDPSERARSTAVTQLKAFGLSTYAARTFVALVSLGEGTAQDVSDIADIPRTRVDDAADELNKHGLVDIKQSSPRRYWAISTETTGRHFEQEHAHRVTALTDALDALETTSPTTEQRGVWTVTGRDTVTERVVDFICRRRGRLHDRRGGAHRRDRREPVDRERHGCRPASGGVRLTRFPGGCRSRRAGR